MEKCCYSWYHGLFLRGAMLVSRRPSVRLIALFSGGCLVRTSGPQKPRHDVQSFTLTYDDCGMGTTSMIPIRGRVNDKRSNRMPASANSLLYCVIVRCFPSTTTIISRSCTAGEMMLWTGMGSPSSGMGSSMIIKRDVGFMLLRTVYSVNSVQILGVPLGYEQTPHRSSHG